MKKEDYEALRAAGHKKRDMGTKAAAKEVVEVVEVLVATDATLTDLLKEHELAFVKFYAPWSAAARPPPLGRVLCHGPAGTGSRLFASIWVSAHGGWSGAVTASSWHRSGSLRPPRRSAWR